MEANSVNINDILFAYYCLISEMDLPDYEDHAACIKYISFVDGAREMVHQLYNIYLDDDE